MTSFFSPKPLNASNSSELKEFFQRFPTPNDFLRAYPVSLQNRILASGLTPVLLSDRKGIPSLALLAALYGPSTPTEWLKSQLVSLNCLSEPRLQMSLAQLEETANLIQSAYPQLTAADICLFIARLKIGNYGPFYGSIDPMKIMSFLRQYANERQRAKSQVSHPKSSPTSLTDERQPVTYETYLETVRKAKAGDPEAIRELTPPPGKQ